MYEKIMFRHPLEPYVIFTIFAIEVEKQKLHFYM